MISTNGKPFLWRIMTQPKMSMDTLTTWKLLMIRNIIGVLHEPEGNGKQGCRLRKQQETGETPKKKQDNKSFVNALTTILEEIQKEDDEQDDLWFQREARCMLEYYLITMACMIASTLRLLLTACLFHVFTLLTPIRLAIIFFLPHKLWKQLSAKIMTLGAWLTPTLPADVLLGKCCKPQYHHNWFPPWLLFFKPKQYKCKRKYYPISIVLTSTDESMKDPLTPPCHFNSDLFLIGIDNHATTTISNNKSHFIRPIHPTTNVGVKGFGGNMIKAIGKGTLK